MAISALEKDSMLQNREMKQRRYSFRVRIKGNATPANKVLEQELPNINIVRAQGQTANADAVEDLHASFTTASDSTGKYGLLLPATQIGSVDRIVPSAIKVDALDGSTTTAVALSCGGVQNGISPGGNIAIDMSTSNDLSNPATQMDVIVTIEYYLI